MSAAVLQLAKPSPGLFPEELRDEEMELSIVRDSVASKPDLNSGQAIASWMEEVIGYSMRVVEIRTKILLAREAAYQEVMGKTITKDVPVSILRDLVNAKIARYIAAFDHCERLEAHMARAIEAYRSILSGIKQERALSAYAGAPRNA